ncbi:MULTISPECIES: LysR family transcriptional regulator [unclassified Mesorhizobium]|uniref:LysR family transcriptional regulator n=1 Tax=unclassified Mesorhizobium TaxID=325217 RepID=UPI0003D00923|nr:LysR family transcriptional regulator [Mesorhizobium sp. L2C085B000]ESZ10660.1 LysR family transcriptional regulator [Mesorhizobium sp. L2C085B000]
MRFKGLDLNLLVVLDALMRERKVTAAARSINLSQPAMSAAVARLRAYFNDELFTMNGRELILTPRADGLAPAVRDALLHIQLSIISPDAFNPAQSDRLFRIMLSDYITLVFFRKIVERAAQEAPAVRFECLPICDDPEELLRRGDVDFLIMPEVFMSKHPRAALFEDKLVGVGCGTNKQLSEPLTFERYLCMGHVVLKFRHTRQPTMEEWYLLEHGFERRIEVVVQGFSLIPPVLSGTNRIGTMPLRLAQHFAKATPLRIVQLPPPLPPPAFTEAVQWPELHNSDPASMWMREMMLQEASRLAPLPEIIERLGHADPTFRFLVPTATSKSRAKSRKMLSPT